MCPADFIHVAAAGVFCEVQCRRVGICNIDAPRPSGRAYVSKCIQEVVHEALMHRACPHNSVIGGALVVPSRERRAPWVVAKLSQEGCVLEIEQSSALDCKTSTYTKWR